MSQGDEASPVKFLYLVHTLVASDLFCISYFPCIGGQLTNYAGHETGDLDLDWEGSGKLIRTAGWQLYSSPCSSGLHSVAGFDSGMETV